MTSARPAIGAVESPSAWLAAELEASTDWWHVFTDAEVDEIDAALEHARAVDPDLDLAQLTADRFPLPTVATLVEAIQQQLVDGKGVMVCSGFPSSATNSLSYGRSGGA